MDVLFLYVIACALLHDSSSRYRSSCPGGKFSTKTFFNSIQFNSIKINFISILFKKGRIINKFKGHMASFFLFSFLFLFFSSK